MYICSVLLYRCYLSVYSRFLLIVDVHSVVWWMPACGEVGLKPCASCRLALKRARVFTNHNVNDGQSNVQKRALWVTDLPPQQRQHHHHQQTLGIILSQSHWSRLLFHLGSVRSNSRYEFSRRRNRTSKLSRMFDSHISSRGTGSTFDISQHERASFTTKNLLNIRRLFAINVHCKKKKNKQFFTCILYFAPLFLLLCWTSPLDSWIFLRSVIYAGSARLRLGFCALLSAI